MTGSKRMAVAFATAGVLVLLATVVSPEPKQTQVATRVVPLDIPSVVTVTIPTTTTITSIPPDTTTTVVTIPRVQHPPDTEPPPSTEPPQPEPVQVEAVVYDAPTSYSVNWDAIAQCESGGNWAINTGNGYYGGLQMNMGFWNSYGDTATWSRPDLAPREAQIAAAQAAYDSGRGTGPWPVCGRRG